MNEQDVEAILTDFRSWLMQALAAPDVAAAPPLEAQSVDLHTLVSQFVALRHEVNLQTRATRGQQEQNAQTLAKLAEAVAALENNQAAAEELPEQAHLERLRPFLKTLIDVHDALALACREAQRVKESVLPALELIVGTMAPYVAAQTRSPEVFVRFLGAGKVMCRVHGSSAEQLPAEDFGQAVKRVRRLVNSLIDGYTMSLQRLERTLEQVGLEAIPAVGEPFDPEMMEVVEVVHEAGREVTEVLDEVRRGYLWQGRVFRCAQVRVARPAP
jgi:molecular chaperone GrpE